MDTNAPAFTPRSKIKKESTEPVTSTRKKNKKKLFPLPPPNPIPNPVPEDNYEESEEPEEIPPVCTFWLKGRCRVVNCRFRHWTDEVCTHFAKGFCAFGENCPYSHQGYQPNFALFESQKQMEEEEIRKLTEGKIVLGFKTQGILDKGFFPNHPESYINYDDESEDEDEDDIEESFPLLGNVKPMETQPQLSSGLTMAQRVTLSSIKNKFDWIPEEIVVNLFFKHSMQQDKTEEELHNVSPQWTEMREEKQKKAQEQKEKSKFMKLRKLRFSEADTFSRSLLKITKQSRTDMNYNKIHKNSRDAILAHRQLYLHFQNLAKMARDGEMASKFFKESLYHKGKLEEISSGVSHEIFDIRNEAQIADDEGDFVYLEYDLHGVTTTGVILLLNKLLRSEEDNHKVRIYRLITGVGRHSNYTPSLLPIVQSYCTERGINYYLINSPDGPHSIQFAVPRFYATDYYK